MNQIKKARLVVGLKQTDIAREMGVSSAAVSHWENGYTMPAAGKLKKLAAILKTSVSELLGEKEETETG